MRELSPGDARKSPEVLGGADRPLTISALPKGAECWRIDWFGDIAFPNRTIRRSQPSVFLHLSRLTDPRYLHEPERLLAPDSTSALKFQRRTWISIGTLPLLRRHMAGWPVGSPAGLRIRRISEH